MKEYIGKLKKEISSYLEVESSKRSPFSFSTTCPDNHISEDADIYFYLFYKNKPFAKAGISKGLSSYYREEDFFGLDVYSSSDPLVLNAVDRAEGKWGVTLMQSFTGTRDLRKTLSKEKISYKNILMNKLEEVSQEFKFPVEFFIPGKMVFWNLDTLNGDMPFTCKGRESIFYENYDAVAKRFGFKLSPDESLYER